MLRYLSIWLKPRSLVDFLMTLLEFSLFSNWPPGNPRFFLKFWQNSLKFKLYTLPLWKFPLISSTGGVADFLFLILLFVLSLMAHKKFKLLPFFQWVGSVSCSTNSNSFDYQINHDIWEWVAKMKISKHHLQCVRCTLRNSNQYSCKIKR